MSSSGPVTVTTSPTNLMPEGRNGTGGSSPGQVFAFNNGAQTVYFSGDTDVSASGAKQGQPLSPGQRAELGLVAGRPMYGITASGSASVIVTVV